MSHFKTVKLSTELEGSPLPEIATFTEAFPRPAVVGTFQDFVIDPELPILSGYTTGLPVRYRTVTVTDESWSARTSSFA